MAKYKIVVCNLGYEARYLDDLDQQTGELSKLLKKIKRVRPSEKGKTIDGFKVTQVNYNITEQDFLTKNDNCVDVILTDDIDRAVYIRKL